MNFFSFCAASDHKLLHMQHSQRMGSRSGCICPAAFQWLVHCCWRQRKPPASGNANAETHTDTQTEAHTWGQQSCKLLHNATKTQHRQTDEYKHTQLLLQHCKWQHKRWVQWRCLNGVQQWSSLASESSQMMSIPRDWIGGFSLLHVRPLTLTLCISVSPVTAD